jgi:hypothetical protein
MLELLLWWLLVAVIAAILVGILLFFGARLLFIQIAERMAAMIDRRVGGAAAHAFTRLGKYAQATGVPLAEAERVFGAHIDRLARIMDSAITVPILGKVGLDAFLSLIPGVGSVAGTAFALTLVARTLRYGPPTSLVSKMLANVVVDLMLGSIPVIGFFADMWFKANDRNAALMREFLGAKGDADPRQSNL